ncbi:MAG TPA: EAL domain-containing protein [Bacillota bacterium]|nr:EAL domain-containing protein [Bacillota bacterium]
MNIKNQGPNVDRDLRVIYNLLKNEKAVMAINRKRHDSFLLYGIAAALVGLIAGISIYIFVRNLLINNAQSSLVELARQGAKQVENQLNTQFIILESLSSLDVIKDPTQPWSEKKRIIEAINELKLSNLKRISLADRTGQSNTSDGNSLFIGDRSYFLKALAGERNVSEPLLSRLDGTMIIVFAVPVVYKEKVTGVLYATYSLEKLSEITENIRFGAKGNSFIIDHEGKILAHEDRSLVYNQKNDLAKNPQYTALTSLIEQMMAGQTGAGEYKYQNQIKFLSFAPIANTGWSFVIAAPRSEVFGNFDQVLTLFISLLCLMFLLSSIFFWQTSALHNTLTVNQTILNKAIETAHLVIIGCDHRGKVLSFNEFAEKMEIAEDHVVGHCRIHDLVPKNKQAHIDRLLQLMQTKSFTQAEFPILRHDSKKIHFLWSIIATQRFPGDPEELIFMGIDISERVKSEQLLRANNKKLTQLYRELAASEEELRRRYEELQNTQEKLVQSEERYQLAQEGSNDILWDLNIDEDLLYISPKFYELFGYDSSEPVNTWQRFIGLTHPEDTTAVRESLDRCLSGQTSLFQHELRLRAADGDYRWLSMRGKLTKDRNGNLRMAGSLTEITERKFQDLLIQQLAFTDHLTGLPNRASLNQKLARVVQQATAKGVSGALFYVDIDNFKLINDAYGHSFGDIVLKNISKLLLTTLPNVDVYRFGGDEFVLLIPEVNGGLGAQDLANSIMQIFASPFVIKDRVFHISFSMGITLFPKDGETLEELLKNADTALFRAKEAGKNRWFLFDQAMKDEATEKMEMENSLRSALKNREFFLVFQPQFNPVTGQVVGFEALLRWKSPKYGFVPTDRFIRLAEANGLIIPIGLWVLEQSARFAARLIQEGINGVIISVNLSARQLMQGDFVEQAVQATVKNGVLPSQIGLELTETAVMESYENNLETLRLLKNEGFKLFLDDFGTGYSSLSYLRIFPLDAVKIDKSFVADISDKNHQPLVRSIIDLAHQINLNVVGEGVETPEQLNCLTNWNCDQVQGYLLGRPVEEEEAVKIAKRGKVVIQRSM